MKITELKYSQYSIPLKFPFVTNKTSLTNRTGIILQLTDDKGNTAFGEASPLPGFSAETIDSVINTIQLIKSDTSALEISVHFKSILDQFPYLAETPSLLFGFEQAINSLHLTSIDRKKKLTKEIDVNAVVSLTEENEIPKIISSLIESGYETIKLKIGKTNIDNVCRILDKLQNLYGNNILFRLDVNQQWNYNEALINLNQLKDFRIEFVEQPVASANDLLRLADKCPVPVAPDESVAGYDSCLQFLDHPNINHIVIKPSMIGFNESLKIIDEANKRNKTVVVSSLFESSVGISGLVYLATHVKNNTAHGLSTTSFFAKDFLPDSRFKKPVINFEYQSYPPTFELQELSFK